ncbi:MAG: hypothetical protein ACLPWS_08900 [Rhodomicrobium sp.]
MAIFEAAALAMVHYGSTSLVVNSGGDATGQQQRIPLRGTQSAHPGTSSYAG